MDGKRQHNPPIGLTTGRDELFTKAFDLAFFLHPKEEVAFQVALDAMARLEVTSHRQQRRRRYTPAGRRRSDGPRIPASRYRVHLDRGQLLQLLVYIASEPWEVRQEQDRPDRRPDDDDMTVRFVAYLVRICLGRNAFHTALGIGRLLHDYSTEEVMAFYDLLVQNPDRYAAHDYMRERKKVLLDQLRKRFAGQIETYRGAHGEIRLQPQAPSPSRTALVEQALHRFTPWHSTCALPECFDPLGEEIEALRFDGADPDAEHTVEILRIHALLHPRCFERLARNLAGDPPARRLTVPRFFAVREESEPPPRRTPPPAPGAEMLAAVTEDLARRAARRRLAVGSRLAVRVDGVEVSTWQIETHRRMRCEIDDDTERVEIWAVEEGQDDVLLALHLCAQQGDSSVALEAGGSIGFRVVGGQDQNLVLEMTHRRHTPWQAVLLAGRRSVRWLGQFLPAPAPRPMFGHRGWQAVIAVFLLVAGALLVDHGLRSTPPERDSEAVVRGSAAVGLPLSEVEAVFVEVLGETPEDHALRKALVAGLSTIPGWRAVDSPDAAQAVLRQMGREPAEATTLLLINRRGDVLWQGTFRGEPEDVAAQASNRLARARDHDRPNAP